jgi:hypothetical protein
VKSRIPRQSVARREVKKFAKKSSQVARIGTSNSGMVRETARLEAKAAEAQKNAKAKNEKAKKTGKDK